MSYQLPPAAKTSKLMNLPADLLAIAEEALAEKFNLPEIVVEKPKPSPKAQTQKPTTPAGGSEWSSHRPGEHLVTVSVQSREMRARPMEFHQFADLGIDPREAMRVQMEQQVRMSDVAEPVWYHQTVSIDRRRSGFEETEYILDRTLRELVERVYRQSGGRPRGDMTMSCDGYTYPIKNRQDITGFIERELK